MSVAIAPGSPEHMRMITPSKVSAILGISRFTSPYRIWHQMRGNLPPEPASEIFARGHDFEPAMAEIWRREKDGGCPAVKSKSSANQAASDSLPRQPLTAGPAGDEPARSSSSRPRRPPWRNGETSTPTRPPPTTSPRYSSSS